MKLIETIENNNHIISVYFETLNDKPKYTVIPQTKNTDYPYPVAKKIKSFTSREAADHYTKQF
jgi:hypothetical protein